MNKNIIASIFKMVLEVNKKNKDVWLKEMYKKRWKNFWGSFLYVLISIGFFSLGLWQKKAFFTPVHWGIWMGLAGIFILLGIYNILAYAYMILKGNNYLQK